MIADRLDSGNAQLVTYSTNKKGGRERISAVLLTVGFPRIALPPTRTVRHEHQQRDNARSHDHHDDAFNQIGHLPHDLIGHLLGAAGHRLNKARSPISQLLKYVFGLRGLGFILVRF